MMYVLATSRWRPAADVLVRRFGAPSHRLEAQLQATARVLEINCQAIYIPGVLLISFGDVATHTSEIKVRFLCASSLGERLTWAPVDSS